MERPDNDLVIRSRFQRWSDRLTRRYVVGALAIGVVAVLSWKFPRWAIGRAHHAYIACINDLYDTGVGDPETCRQGALLLIPKLVPWTRHDARAEASQIAYDVARDRLKVAALRALDAAAVDRAARALVDALNASPAPNPDFTPSSQLQMFGAGNVLVERAAEIGGGAERGDALATAMWRGDAAGLTRIAALPVDEGESDVAAATGAVACALGDRQAGVVALQRWSDLMRKASDSGSTYDPAQSAIAACKPDANVTTDDVWKDRLGFVRAVCGGEAHAIQEIFDTPAAAALEVTLRTANTQDDFLGMIAPRNNEAVGPTRAFFTPWSLLAEPTDWPIAAAWADETAARLDALATTAKPPPKPKDPDETDYFLYKSNNASRDNPAAYLRYGALLVELEAAYGWARRGDLDKARTSALHALDEAHAADGAHLFDHTPALVTATLQLAGAGDVADREIAAMLAAPPLDDVTRTLLLVQRSLALAHEGKLADAYAALDPVMKLELDEQWRGAVTWLRAALGLAIGKDSHLQLPAAPATLGPSASSSAVLAYWLKAATASPEAQALVRWKSYDENGWLADTNAVLPAFYYVVGKAAGSGDVELWLDIVTGRTTTDPQAVVSARAEAARWRGDAAAAQRWDQRLAAIRAIPRDDCGAYLLRVVLNH